MESDGAIQPRNTIRVAILGGSQRTGRGSPMAPPRPKFCSLNGLWFSTIAPPYAIPGSLARLAPSRQCNDRRWFADVHRRMSVQPSNFPAEGSEPAISLRGRPWIGVTFTCAGQYLRIYRQPDASRYHGRCPACGRSVVFRLAPGGTDARQFEVSCR